MTFQTTTYTSSIHKSKNTIFVCLRRQKPKMKHNYADIESLTLINEYRWYYRLCNYAKKEDNSNRNCPYNR